MCDCKSKDYAKLQQASYDIQNNKILYGTSNQIGSLGVSDGTTNKKCNVFDAMVYKKPCSAFIGTAGGNPCKKQNSNSNQNSNQNSNSNPLNIENFENKKHNGYDITMIINIVLIFLLIIILIKLFYTTL
jgi:hypothetical protein